MKILVTGGAGFIGSHLVEELIRQKHEVTVLDNLSTGSLQNLKSVKKKINFIKCDLTKGKNFTKFLKNVYCIVHLAGLVEVTKSFKNPSKYNQTNVTGTLNILKAAGHAKVKKFVYAASASCYGSSKKLPSSEKSEIQILSPYALTKWIAEQLVISWAKIYNLSSISLRFFNVYGSRSKNPGSYSAVINVFIKQKLSKKPLTIVGDGKQTRSFVHVSDVVKAIIKAAESKISGEIFNVGGEKSVQIKELAKLLGGKKIHIAKRLGELKYSSANIKKIQKRLHWKPKIDIATGLRMLVKEF